MQSFFYVTSIHSKMSTFSTIDQLAAMATVPSPYASVPNNQSFPVLVGTTSFDVESGSSASGTGISTSPTPTEEIVVINTVPPSATARTSTLVPTTDNECSNVQWKDCDMNDNNEPISIDGKTWKQISVLKLHKICSKLQVNGVKNAKKDVIIESIINTYKNSLAYDTLKLSIEEADKENRNFNQPANEMGKTMTTRKEPQCPYRLMNILFSDDFAEEFGTIANTPHRSMLDSGKAANESGFGIKIQEAF
jgi:hypothetical protein